MTRAAKAPAPRYVITFDEATHTYRVNGLPVHGASSILARAGLGRDYAGVPPHMLANAAARGVHVDQCCLLYDEGTLDWGSVHPEALPYVKAWAHFRERARFRPTHQQTILYHPELNYCCTDDVEGFLDGVVATVERKCVAKLDRSYGLQTAAQTYPGIIDQQGARLPQPRLRAVVQLKRDATYTLCVDNGPDPQGILSPDDFAVWEAACRISAWRDRDPS